MSDDAMLVAQGVRKQYFRKGRDAARYFDAVRSTDVTLRRGELLELVGRSGSGKTTLLSMLAGLLTPTDGTVMFEGRDLYALDDAELSRVRNEHFGVVPQGQTPLADLTVLQNVCLPHCLYRDPGDVESRALGLLESLGIAELSECYPAELSGGEMRRMAIARALVCEPDVVFADEPTGDLDDENTRVVLQALRDVADAGAAVLLVTHEQSAASYADRTLRLSASQR
ncbi:MAG: ABC transporter ATP-binding protein [Atopobiaceae bacterium]|nr:ABC transporter ATP-binding protein [Atopobiaceae bacterium]